MAVKDSDQIATDSNYPLGDYSFRIERSSVPGSYNDQITAICTQGGKNARKSIQVPSSVQIAGWYVEANENIASVYVQYSDPGDDGPLHVQIPYSNYFKVTKSNWLYPDVTYDGTQNDVRFVGSPRIPNSNWPYIYAASKYTYYTLITPSGSSNVYTTKNYTYKGKTVWYHDSEDSFVKTATVATSPYVDNSPAEQVAWTIVYSRAETINKTVLIGRFAIDLEDAGGVGPGGSTGGGWTDPGDYDEDWEEGDPTHTLYVEVTGALSGRHNDPIVDPSYSYIPADKDTVKDYGCGGDGGHGGGGGAGASTVVIHKFATNQANSKEVTAIARRHGYGSGGGKGGKGGDGCILIYY